MLKKHLDRANTANEFAEISFVSSDKFPTLKENQWGRYITVDISNQRRVASPVRSYDLDDWFPVDYLVKLIQVC